MGGAARSFLVFCRKEKLAIYFGAKELFKRRGWGSARGGGSDEHEQTFRRWFIDGGRQREKFNIHSARLASIDDNFTVNICLFPRATSAESVCTSASTSQLAKCNRTTPCRLTQAFAAQLFPAPPQGNWADWLPSQKPLCAPTTATFLIFNSKSSARGKLSSSPLEASSSLFLSQQEEGNSNRERNLIVWLSSRYKKKEKRRKTRKWRHSGSLQFEKFMLLCDVLKPLTTSGVWGEWK